MKDYGNAGALCGALGCMVLLIVSMHFAKAEDKPKTEKVSAEVVFDEKKMQKRLPFHQLFQQRRILILCLQLQVYFQTIMK